MPEGEKERKTKMQRQEEKQVREKKMVFMMGAPASGKSTIAQTLHLRIIDSDAIKERHPDYDPLNPSVLHQWSAVEMEKEFQKAVLEEESVVIDGTGANSDRTVRRVTEAKANGFRTELVYVTVSLKTCLERNQRRPRHVPDEVIISKYHDVKYAFEIVAKYVDAVRVVDNE